MPTPWFYSNSVTQYAEVSAHIPWNGESNGYLAVKRDDGTVLTTTKSLVHIANPTVNDIKNKTNYLYLKDFRLTDLPDVISGVEIEISMGRGGRITDETIQLMYNDTFIGENRAYYKLDEITIYGGPADLHAADITPALLSDVEFGIGVRYQSHPMWPHREIPRIDYIRLRVW